MVDLHACNVIRVTATLFDRPRFPSRTVDGRSPRKVRPRMHPEPPRQCPVHGSGPSKQIRTGSGALGATVFPQRPNGPPATLNRQLQRADEEVRPGDATRRNATWPLDRFRSLAEVSPASPLWEPSLPAPPRPSWAPQTPLPTPRGTSSRNARAAVTGASTP